MRDITELLKEGDKFSFQKITILARKMLTPKLKKASSSHRSTSVIFKVGTVTIDKVWDLKPECDKNDE